MPDSTPSGTAQPEHGNRLRDGLLLLGLALLAIGAWMIYPPASFLLLGIIITALAIFGVPRWGS